MLIRLSEKAPFHHLPQVTAEYRHFRGGSHILGEHAAERRGFLSMKARVIEKHRHRHSAEVSARVIDLLRREAVAAQGNTPHHSGGFEQERRLFQSERQALNEALELHRSAIAEHDENAQRLYAEIERLNGIIKAMEGTKAWGLHRSLERLRGR